MAQAHDDGPLDLLKAAGGIDGLADVVSGPHFDDLYPSGDGIHLDDGGLGADHPHDGGAAGLAAVHRRRIEDIGGAVTADGQDGGLLVKDAGLAHLVDVDALVRVRFVLDIALAGVSHL